MTEFKEIVLLGGRPGSGKSTLAHSISESINRDKSITSVEHLSIGDHLRLLGRGVMQSAYSNQIHEHSKALNKSQRLPAEVVRNVVEEYLLNRNSETQYVLVDGYPRYVDEIDPFLDIANNAGYEIPALFHLDLPYDIAKSRILSRGRRESEREIDDEFATWRLEQHDTTYSIAMGALKNAGVPIYNLDALLPPQKLATKVVSTLNTGGK